MWYNQTEYFNMSELNVNNIMDGMQRDLRMEISKSDWKLYRNKIAGWQENYMACLNKEYIALLSADDKKASEKF